EVEVVMGALFSHGLTQVHVNPSIRGQRLDLETRCGERTTPRQHDCSVKIGELKGEGAQQGLAAGGSFDSPSELNGGFTNMLSREKRTVNCRRSAGASKAEPFERSSKLIRVITYLLPAPVCAAEI